MRLSWGGLPEAFQNAIDGCVRSNFTEVVPADAIGDREQPSARTRVFRRRWRNVSEIIFIALAYSAYVRELRKFDIHGVVERTVAFGDPGWSDSGCLKASIH